MKYCCDTFKKICESGEAEFENGHWRLNTEIDVYLLVYCFNCGKKIKHKT